MKNTRINCTRALLLGILLGTASLAHAQTQTTTTSSTSTTSSAGTISQFSPNVITVRTESSSSPVSYSYTKTTTYVDQNGNPVSMDVVKSGLPVTVYYTQDGDRMVASKVIVRRTVTSDMPAPVPVTPTVIEKKSSSTTTTTSGQ